MTQLIPGLVIIAIEPKREPLSVTHLSLQIDTTH